ncbi:MAG: conjugal transfer protein TraN [Desulfobacterales bacterium]|nr:conjugal transfer protein TraN [Desulfobacterales bacterium]
MKNLVLILFIICIYSTISAETKFINCDGDKCYLKTYRVDMPVMLSQNTIFMTNAIPIENNKVKIALNGVESEVLCSNTWQPLNSISGKTDLQNQIKCSTAPDGKNIAADIKVYDQSTYSKFYNSKPSEQGFDELINTSNTLPFCSSETGTNSITNPSWYWEDHPGEEMPDQVVIENKYNANACKYEKEIDGKWYVFSKTEVTNLLIGSSSIPDTKPLPTDVCVKDIDGDGVINETFEYGKCRKTDKGNLCLLEAVKCLEKWGDPKCLNSGIFSSEKERCEFPVKMECPPGGLWSEERKQCETIVNYNCPLNNEHNYTDPDLCNTKCLNPNDCQKIENEKIIYSIDWPVPGYDLTLHNMPTPYNLTRNMSTGIIENGIWYYSYFDPNSGYSITYLPVVAKNISNLNELPSNAVKLGAKRAFQYQPGPELRDTWYFEVSGGYKCNGSNVMYPSAQSCQVSCGSISQTCSSKCPPLYTNVQDSGMCSYKFQCPPGGTWNNERKRCEAIVSYSCPYATDVDYSDPNVCNTNCLNPDDCKKTESEIDTIYTVEDEIEDGEAMFKAYYAMSTPYNLVWKGSANAGGECLKMSMFADSLGYSISNLPKVTKSFSNLSQLPPNAIKIGDVMTWSFAHYGNPCKRGTYYFKIPEEYKCNGSGVKYPSAQSCQENCGSISQTCGSKCPDSYENIQNSGMCVNYLQECPENYQKDPETGVCYSSPNCVEGTYNGTEKKCYEGKTKCPFDVVEGDTISKEYPCLEYEGTNYCNNRECVDLAGNEIVDPSTVGESDLEDNGDWDSNGNCLGQIYIYNGSDSRCRYDGVKILGENCCTKKKNILGDIPDNVALLTPETAPIALLNNSVCEVMEVVAGVKAQEGLCVNVGGYCSNRIKFPFGGSMCIERKQTYCCFNSKFGKITQVEGRKQLGLSWGSPESPNCRGLTPDEFQSIDFSNINFDEAVQDMDIKNSIDLNSVSTEKANENVPQGE